MDKIYIRDLLVRTVVGIFDWEQKKKQDVLLNIVLHTDLTVAGQSDKIEDTVDYKELRNRIVSAVEEGRFSLIEAIAERVSHICLDDAKVRQATPATEAEHTETVGVIDDQQRIVTPAKAIATGADYLVVGRPIRDAADPRAAAEAIQRQIASAL